MTEDLVDLLSVVPELRVRPRGETTRFRDQTRDVRDAGRELGVDVVVDGSLRRMGELVRVSVRLVTVASAMLDLKRADKNGLIDLLWLDRCPVFEGMRAMPEFVTVRESTARRVERIERVLEP